MNYHKKLHNLITETDELTRNISPLETTQRARLRAGLLRAHVDLVNVHRLMHHHNIGLAPVPHAHETQT